MAIVVNHQHYPGAEEYYMVPEADAFLDTPVPKGFKRWRCVLCGCPAGDIKEGFEAGAYCCGGCGMACLRPIEEFPGKDVVPTEETCNTVSPT